MCWKTGKSLKLWIGVHVRTSGRGGLACVLKSKCTEFVSKRLSEKFGKLWLAAEVLLFVLVGAAVDIRCTLEAGGAALLMIVAALTFRAVGVCLCLLGTNLNRKEKIFCVIAYLPKATVQAAIGSVPMGTGPALRSFGTVRGSAGNFDYSASWSHWNGRGIQKAAFQRVRNIGKKPGS